MNTEGRAPVMREEDPKHPMTRQRMQQFTTLNLERQEVRDVAERTQDFREIARPYDTAEARAQASRCEQCGVPFCSVHCPLHNNIPDWLQLAAEGRLKEAW